MGMVVPKKFETRLYSIGNSLVVTVPARFCHEGGYKQGDWLEVKIKKVEA